MKILSKIDQGLMRFFDVVMASSNLAICIMILIGAFMRYILKKDFYGMEELVLLIAFWMYFIGSAVATREGSQVSADLVSSMLKSERQKAVLTLVRTLITLILFAILVKWAWSYMLWSLEKRPTTAVYKLPMAIAHAALLLSFVLSVLYEIKHYCSDAQPAVYPGKSATDGPASSDFHFQQQEYGTADGKHIHGHSGDVDGRRQRRLAGYAYFGSSCNGYGDQSDSLRGNIGRESGHGEYYAAHRASALFSRTHDQYGDTGHAEANLAVHSVRMAPHTAACYIHPADFHVPAHPYGVLICH